MLTRQDLSRVTWERGEDVHHAVVYTSELLNTKRVLLDHIEVTSNAVDAFPRRDRFASERRCSNSFVAPLRLARRLDSKVLPLLVLEAWKIICSRHDMITPGVERMLMMKELGE